ncbi:uncharacterized protein UV8b_03662 [Ustilaginoidea virens]|uniref:Transcription factor Iwr1 domain-containing protein n=1 Tax=Ustilaginoidea virens TaxID=1159556 RepID=A0A8E5HPX3_USTVR|nr:uncharacterized protein UV8b_03662 [Ustilaginoidea virens]QUC19421.1 hypothetical protein UV8b_03662 [Ustilaginoidea virens]
MSIPPQLIRVKRKRVDDTPVTFLQFDHGSFKRPRSGSNWAYQRRDSVTQLPRPQGESARPVIHVSHASDAQNPPRGQQHGAAQAASAPAPGLLRPRKYRVSRSTLARGGTHSPNPHPSGVSKRNRYGPAVFVESTREEKKTPRARNGAQAAGPLPPPSGVDNHPTTQQPPWQRQLKRPGLANRTRQADFRQQTSATNFPLPDSLVNRHEDQDMDRITDDMNQWVLNELGANLQSMQQDKKPTRFKPKSPAKRYHERHPEPAPRAGTDTTMDRPMRDAGSGDNGGDDDDEDDGDDDDGDDDEWVIDEYVRIPANSVALDASPAEVGLLVLDDEEESLLFSGSALDDDDELAEDEEDENAENHYAADYPEDEADSDDEYGPHAYLYRHCNNSDEEEYDENLYDDQDEIVLEGGAAAAADDDDDDARMARIKEFMKRSSALR